MEPTLHAKQLHAQAHSVHRPLPEKQNSQLEKDIQAYAESVMAQQREQLQGATSGLERVDTRLIRVGKQTADAMREYYEMIGRGFQVVSASLEQAGHELPEVSEETLAIFEDPDAFMKAQEEGIYNVLGYSPEIMTQIYTALDELFQRADFEKARDGFYFLITISPQTPEYWKALGLIEIKLTHYDKANEAYLKAIDLDPSNTDSYLNALYCYEEIDQFDEAEKLCEKGIAFARENSAEEWARELEETLLAAKKELAVDSKKEL